MFVCTALEFGKPNKHHNSGLQLPTPKQQQTRKAMDAPQLSIKGRSCNQTLLANSSFKVICRTRYRTDGQTKRRLYASPFWEHKNMPHKTIHVLLGTKVV